MKEELITFETAKLAHSKRCYEFSAPMPSLIFEEKYRPTQSLLQTWLREIHNIFVNVDVNYCYKIYYKDELNSKSGDFHNYEEALEYGLQAALKLIDNG